jgi:hypothetical protein
MTTNRREFIEHIGATAMLGALPIAALNPLVGAVNTPPATTTEEWDFSWTHKWTGQ